MKIKMASVMEVTEAITLLGIAVMKTKLHYKKEN